MKRIAWLEMTWDVLLVTVAGHEEKHFRVTSSLPEDARVAYLEVDHERRIVKVFFESETLDPVPEGAVIPRFDVVMTTYWPVPV